MEKNSEFKGVASDKEYGSSCRESNRSSTQWEGTCWGKLAESWWWWDDEMSGIQHTQCLPIGGDSFSLPFDIPPINPLALAPCFKHTWSIVSFPSWIIHLMLNLSHGFIEGQAGFLWLSSSSPMHRLTPWGHICPHHHDEKMTHLIVVFPASRALVFHVSCPPSSSSADEESKVRGWLKDSPLIPPQTQEWDLPFIEGLAGFFLGRSPHTRRDPLWPLGSIVWTPTTWDTFVGFSMSNPTHWYCIITMTVHFDSECVCVLLKNPFKNEAAKIAKINAHLIFSSSYLGREMELNMIKNPYKYRRRADTAWVRGGFGKQDWFMPQDTTPCIIIIDIYREG